ncbi:ImmA/IrrE family metallo-endopeptidase [Hallerella porci]|uniref:Uncharacterized protein DUF955 n=1 Tax=Hallerella porci TaxID=1945871 RepID=A0ABX5LTC6_9BACT|nr:ImmA/IrrE family metallo-endopeptidase [Hallerella porci]PWL03705.1 uncharacterized protein DUF955 [Hallerella porci]
MNFKATALSIKDIRQIVKLIRKKCGLENCHNIPVCELFEWVLNKLFDEVEWEIVPKSKMAEEGITFTGLHCIKIREDVYINACQGDGRARFTIMHEIGHFILHDPTRVALCRLAPGERLRAFEDPEWQADTFAAEFLMDLDLIKGMEYKQISAVCGVTFRAAQTRIAKLQKEGSN